MRKQIKNSVIVLLLGVLVSFITFYILLFNKKIDIGPKVKFILNEPIVQEINVGETYQELGAKVYVDTVDQSKAIRVDDENLNVDKVGIYEIVYYIVLNGKKYTHVRWINVIDTIAPIITLNGGNATILIGEEYEELGYEVTDNCDLDLTDNVVIKNNIDNTKEGNYKVTYTVTDSSGNLAEVVREVIVKKPNVVISVVQEEVKVYTPPVDETKYNNTITKNKFTSNGVHLEGYVKDSSNNTLKLVSDNDEYSFSLSLSGNNYKSDINLTDVTNGNYKVYINDEALLNKMTFIEKIKRAKVGNKLVTFNYDDNEEVNIIIEDHIYQYDILIDPGHGGYDSGAVNQYITEKEMNLIVSRYEKCRYEAHGLSVYMTRYDDTYGNGMGSYNLIDLHRRGYEMAYYGAVSKIIYSNHHNSIGNNYYGGYELLIAGALTSDELASELEIVRRFNQIYPYYSSNEGHKRFYARDYVTEVMYSKLNGEIYSFKDNYAINRIPYQVANVKSIIYEGCYMSNRDDFNWYWQKENWHQVSEIKIETYVNSLGITYNSDNTSCL